MQETLVIDGRYRLLRLIGIGGMGSVYEAEHVAIGRRMAVKILHAQYSQHADLVERLRREAQAASRIGHPNIVDVTDFGRTEDGSAYLVMEFLYGTDLGAILRERGSLSETRALSIGLQTAQALAAAHRVGIVHRDLKPENIFIVNPEDFPLPASTSKIMPLPRAGSPPSGSPASVPQVVRDLVKVLDFGIAKQLGSVEIADAPHPTLQLWRVGRLTNPGLTVGTPEYMAPEQAIGEAVDARADIYAVGTLLFEMVCGRVPFVAPSVPELLTMKTEQPAPAPRIFAPQISASLEALILACLARDPQARPQTMEAVEEALQEMVTALAWAAMNQAAMTQELPVPVTVLTDLVGRVAVPASSSVTPPAAASGEVESGSDSDTRISRVSVTSQQPRFSPRTRASLVLCGAAIIMIVGFASARYLTRRAPPLTMTATVKAPAPPAPPTPTPAPAILPPSPPPLPKEPTPSPPAPAPAPAHEDVKMLLEWAHRAAAGKRYTAPPGDNLRELLERIDAIDADNAEAKALRDESIKSLSKRLHDELRRRHALDALESYRAVRALDPSRRLDASRKELLYQLLFLARSGKRGTAREPMLLAAHGAVELTPGFSAAHLALGDALAISGKREAAAQSYRRVLELHPRESEARLAEQGLRRLGKSAQKSKHRRTHHRAHK